MDIVKRLRSNNVTLVGDMKAGTEIRGAMLDAADEIERLTERCAAYKGQVEAGAAEIERLRAIVAQCDKWEPGIRRRAEIELFGFGGHEQSPSADQEG
jgi:hypothetical protein